MKLKQFGLFPVVMGVVFLFAGAAKAGIVGSVHDFSALGWSGWGGQICAPCHTPHHADTSVTDAPLWHHELTTATFTVYSSTTLNAAPGQPNGISKLCLSCHDGTVALDSFGGNAGTTMIAETANVGTDLSGTHPISFTFDTTLANDDGELWDPATSTTVHGGTIQDDLLNGGTSFECSSCHDVHNKYNSGKLLIITSAGSNLCLTCHNK